MTPERKAEISTWINVLRGVQRDGIELGPSQLAALELYAELAVMREERDEALFKLNEAQKDYAALADYYARNDEPEGAA